MRIKTQKIPELPSEEHSFFLLPRRMLSVPLSPTTATNGSKQLQVAYRETGEGPPIVLLHGLWTSGYCFRNLIDGLSDKFRLIIPEISEALESNQLPETEWGPTVLATLFQSFCKALNLEKPTIVAHAESGLGGLWWALDQPESISSLIVIGTSLKLPTRDRVHGWWLSKNFAVARWAGRAFLNPQKAALEMLSYSDWTVVSLQEIRLLASGWSTRPTAISRAQILAQTKSSQYRRELNDRLLKIAESNTAFPVALKLIYGEEDRKAPPEHGRKLTRLFPGSELLVAENSAGSVQVERPEWTARIIAAASSS